MNLLEKYQVIRKASEDMCDPLSIEDYVPQPCEFVSPPKWNLAHTSWFFEELILKKYLPSYTEFNPQFSFLFNSYYQSLGDRIQRANRGDLSRPLVSVIYAYRKYVDEHMAALLSKDLDKTIKELTILGINHEQQHQELFFSDLKYSFSLNPIYPAYSDRAYAEEGVAGTKEFVTFEEGIYEIGFYGNDFAYDNEMPQHNVLIQAFEIAINLVSNAEYAEFIADGGYQKHQFWHDEAWSLLAQEKIKKPMYWKKVAGEWYQYTLAGLRKIVPEAPVSHISYFEAYAFAQWKGMRLPTEFEWEVAADSIKWGDRWEWTESAYLPYPGYKKQEGALGEYNGKFMVNQKVLRGASVVTSEGHARKTYRNFFHPHMGYQFNGIRLVK